MRVTLTNWLYSNLKPSEGTKPPHRQIWHISAVNKALSRYLKWRIRGTGLGAILRRDCHFDLIVVSSVHTTLDYLVTPVALTCDAGEMIQPKDLLDGDRGVADALDARICLK